MTTEVLKRRFASHTEVPVVAFAVVSTTHPDLTLIREAYERAGSGLGLIGPDATRLARERVLAENSPADRIAHRAQRRSA